MTASQHGGGDHASSLESFDILLLLSYHLSPKYDLVE
jgi:hypothetical protein